MFSIAALRTGARRDRPRGEAGRGCVLNVLVEGTTYMKMFDENAYCLFPRDELLSRFAGWTVLDHRIEDFGAGAGQIKRFSTLIARRPAVGA